MQLKILTTDNQSVIMQKLSVISQPRQTTLSDLLVWLSGRAADS